MTCKIERVDSGENAVVLRVCGRIEVEHVSTIEELIGREKDVVVLDLTEVTFAQRDAVGFLADCERKGIELSPGRRRRKPRTIATRRRDDVANLAAVRQPVLTSVGSGTQCGIWCAQPRQSSFN